MLAAARHTLLRSDCVIAHAARLECDEIHLR